jgi:ureidoglycolate dehydrogenase (NAD+)
MAQDSLLIGKAELTAFVSAVFVATGLAKDHAEAWAKMLVWANLRGTDSHGIIRIPRYIDLVKAKSINAAPNIRVERKEGAAVVLEADRAPSAVAMTRAMTEAMDCARNVHVGMCAARNVTHTGAIGYFALQAAEAGFIGIAMSASGPMMAYPGTRVAAVSSNPIAFAVPRRNGRPYLLDFSTGVVANGKIMAAADRGEKIPIGWGLDKDGHDTTDPKAVETILPLGGAKGAGLSFMIECLTSLLLSHPRIAPDLENWAIGDDPFLSTARSLPSTSAASAIRIASRARPSGWARPSPVWPAPRASRRSCCPASAATPSAPSARPRAFLSQRGRGNVSPRRHRLWV